MKKVNVALVRFLQFVVFVLFTFIVMLYFGTMVLLPLDIVVLISKFLHVFGLNTLFGAIVAVPVVAYFGKIIYGTPGLIQMLIDNGMELVSIGKNRVNAFNKIVEAAR
jgi:hypothetical protein